MEKFSCRVSVITLVNFLSIVASSEIFAQARCTEEYLIQKDAKLPHAIVLNAGESILEAVEKSYDCLFIWDGREGMASEVIAKDGEIIGNLEGFLRGARGTGSEVVVSSGGFLGLGEKLVAVPVDQFDSWSSEGLVAHLNGGIIESFPEIRADREEIVSFSQPSVVKEFWDKLTNGNLFLPPKRRHVIFSSEPAPADVVLGDDMLGQTELPLFVREDRMEAIGIRKDGYFPCTFTDGTYSPGAGNEPGRFSCELDQQK